MKREKYQTINNKRDFRADVLSLLTSALRPRLLCVRRSRNHRITNIKFAFLPQFSPITSPKPYIIEKYEQTIKNFQANYKANRGAKRQNLSKIVVASTILFGFSVFLANFSTPVSAVSLTLSVPSEPLSLDIQPTNTFTKSSASSISAKTDAFAGYALTIKAKTDNNLTSGSNKIASISSNLTEEQYKGSGYTNTWGYQPSKINSSANSSFLPGPTTSASTIESTKAKNDTANSYNITLGAKTDSNIPKGIYSNTFIFSATANTVPYTITYNLNSGSWTGISPETGTTAENTVAISGIKPTRSGYEFLGWCTASTTTDACSGTTVQPGNTVTLSNGANNIQLYAMWRQNVVTFAQAYAAAGKSQQSGYYKMQDMTSAICNNVTTPTTTAASGTQTTTLIDTRDNTAYTVAKLKDGKCWMTQNLRIVGKPITSADSDVSSGYTIPSSAKWTASSTNSNYAYYENNTSYGAYYTWYTATAGTGTSSMTTQGQNASGSICPKGWKLPSSGSNSNSDFQQLSKLYTTGLKLAAAPANFTYAGLLNPGNGSLVNQGLGGYYWSSTVYSSTSAYNLHFLMGSVSPDYHYNRPGGFSVRCIARN